MSGPGFHAASRLRICAVCAILAVVPSCGKDSAGPGPAASVGFITQPSTTIAGQAIEPPVEVVIRDAAGRPISGTVTLELDPNPCGFDLSGTLTAQVIGTTAVFGDLTLTRVHRGYTLRASFHELSAMSAPFDVRPSVVTEPLILEDILCSETNPQDDGESLTYVPEDDTFWRADDDRNSIYEVDRRTGVPGAQITLETILEALPDAGVCDDGDGDPNTVCSYVEQFEEMAYGRTERALYVINVVDAPSADRPAIFRLAKGACAGCFTPESWRALPLGLTYSSIVSVEGEIHVALMGRIYAYDYGTNQLATVDANGDSLPPAYATSSPVAALSFDGTFMWILTNQRNIHKVDWATRTEVRRYDLDTFGLSLPRGMAVVGDTIYVLEGDAPNPLYVFSQSEP